MFITPLLAVLLPLCILCLNTQYICPGWRDSGSVPAEELCWMSLSRRSLSITVNYQKWILVRQRTRSVSLETFFYPEWCPVFYLREIHVIFSITSSLVVELFFWCSFGALNKNNKKQWLLIQPRQRHLKISPLCIFLQDVPRTAQD